MAVLPEGTRDDSIPPTYFKCSNVQNCEVFHSSAPMSKFSTKFVKYFMTKTSQSGNNRDAQVARTGWTPPPPAGVLGGGRRGARVLGGGRRGRDERDETRTGTRGHAMRIVPMCAVRPNGTHSHSAQPVGPPGASTHGHAHSNERPPPAPRTRGDARGGLGGSARCELRTVRYA